MTAKTLIPRRDFLGASGVLTGLIAAGSPLTLLVPSRAWAIDLKALSSTEGTTLMAVARTIAPHDKLDDAAYALVIQSIDADAAKDAQLLRMLSDGIHQLGAAFPAAAEPARVQALKAVESTAFFQTLRVKTLGTLYATPLAYAYFGYEGEAFSKGGYLLRGFNDLRWLPEVPLADSGPLPGA